MEVRLKRIFLALMVCLVGFLVWWFFFSGSREIVNYPPNNTTVVAFGDSLIYGTGATKGNDLVMLLSAKLQKPIINLGVPGDTTLDGLARIDKVIEKDPGIVILLLGGNDYLRKVPKETTFTNLRTIISTLQEHGVMVVLLGVRGGILRDGYADEFEKVADEMGVLYVPDVLDGLLGNTQYMSDEVHPNDQGYAYIAEKVFRVMNRYSK